VSDKIDLNKREFSSLLVIAGELGEKNREIERLTTEVRTAFEAGFEWGQNSIGGSEKEAWAEYARDADGLRYCKGCGRVLKPGEPDCDGPRRCRESATVDGEGQATDA